MSEFYVGQKVVCVDDDPPPGLVKVLVRGNTYTITGTLEDCAAVTISEADPSPMTGFWSSRFQAAPSKAIQLFRKIAAEATEKRKITVVEPDRVRARAAHNEVR